MAAVRIRDRQIRDALVAQLRREDPTVTILHELPLIRGEGRADVVAVNGVLAGYEIKSDCDSLSKLSAQAARYESVFERVTVVVAARHLAGARRILPRTWGLVVVIPSAADVELRQVRRPRPIARRDRATLIRLLWKNECTRVLRSQGIRASRQAPVVELWELMETLPVGVLSEAVRDALKARRDFGSGQSRIPSGG